MPRAKKKPQRRSIIFAEGCEVAPTLWHQAIYVLLDPREEGVRYVGKARRPAHRYDDHIWARTQKRPVCRWIASLWESGRTPTMAVVDWAEDWEAAERTWIAGLRQEGHALLNVSAGGLDMRHVRAAKGRHPAYNYLVQRFCRSEQHRQVAHDLTAAARTFRTHLGDLGMVEFERYLMEMLRELQPLAPVCR